MKNKNILKFVSVFLLIAALIVWFWLPAISGTLGMLTVYINYQFVDITFGNSYGLSFNFLNLLPLLILIITILLLIFELLNIKIIKNIPINLNVIAFLALISGLGFLSAIPFTTVINNAEYHSLKLGSGAILSAVLSIISGGIIIAEKYILRK